MDSMQMWNSVSSAVGLHGRITLPSRRWQQKQHVDHFIGKTMRSFNKMQTWLWESFPQTSHDAFSPGELRYSLFGQCGRYCVVRVPFRVFVANVLEGLGLQLGPVHGSWSGWMLWTRILLALQWADPDWATCCCCCCCGGRVCSPNTYNTFRLDPELSRLTGAEGTRGQAAGGGGEGGGERGEEAEGGLARDTFVPKMRVFMFNCGKRSGSFSYFPWHEYCFFFMSILRDFWISGNWPTLTCSNNLRLYFLKAC